MLLSCASRRLGSASTTLSRHFTTSAPSKTIGAPGTLPQRLLPEYVECKTSDLVALQWPAPPRNVLLVKKDFVPAVTEALVEFAKHIKYTYPDINIILESKAAMETERFFDFPIHEAGRQTLHENVDVAATFGGDGTILRASSLFAGASNVPPILSFSMGTLGFLGEWNFAEYKRAFREVYMSGAGAGDRTHVLEKAALPSSAGAGPPRGAEPTGWSAVRGKSMGASRGARVLIRDRLKIGVFSAGGQDVTIDESIDSTNNSIHAMNEVIIHRGKEPHLAIIEVYVGGRFLTEAVADGMIISTPTGSTAYSLSSGGSIVHPLVPSILLTPICARSLSFRPLVLPASTPITLKLSKKNRGRELEVSIDGIRRPTGIGAGMEVRVSGEEVKTADDNWQGGVPCVMRRTMGLGDDDDGWVGGLNGLLKFNYPFGEEV